MAKTKGSKDKQPRKRRKKTQAEKDKTKKRKEQENAKGMQSLTSLFGSNSSTQEEPAIDTEEQPPCDAENTDNHTNAETNTAEDETATHNPSEDADVIDFTEKVTFCVRDPGDIVANLDVPKGHHLQPFQFGGN